MLGKVIPENNIPGNIISKNKNSFRLPNTFIAPIRLAYLYYIIIIIIVI